VAVIQISYRNLADAATLSGGSWLSTLPLANLKDARQTKVARSTNALTTSTRVDIDLGTSPKLARLFALVQHNCSITATYRLTAGTTLGGADVYDSGTLDVWPTVYLPGDLEWEDDNWWTGTISAEDADGYPIAIWHDCAQNVRARYWRIQITDTSNAAGYVQAGRLWLGPVWSPNHGYAFGAGLGWEPRSESQRSLGGSAYFDRRPSARVFTFERVARNDGEIVVIPDPADAQRGFRRNIRGFLRRLDPITQISAGVFGTGYEVEELL
jgi:hypothetical protein